MIGRDREEEGEKETVGEGSREGGGSKRGREGRGWKGK